MKRRKWLWGVLMAALLGWTVYMLLHDQSPADLWAGLRAARGVLLLAGLGLMLLYLCCEAASTWLILRTLGTPAPPLRCLGYACVGFYFSTVTPSSTGGQPMQIWSMTRDGIPGAHATLDMLLISICYQLAAALYALVGCFCFPGLSGRLGKGLWALLVFGFVTALGLAALMTLLLIRPGWCVRLADWGTALLGRLPFVRDPAALRARLDGPIAQYAQGGKLLWRRPTLLPRLLLLSIAQLTCLYLVPWTVYRAFGLTGHNALELAVLQALMAVAVGFLPLPGATGAAESAFLKGFAAFFGPLVTPAVVLSRGISCYGMLVVTGAATLILHLRRRAAQPASAHALERTPQEERPPQKEAS